MPGGSVDILMYHSISDNPGPTSIAPRVFEAQMAALAESGLPVLRMDEVPGHLSSGRGRAVAVTFDDGFQDFADVAWPVLRRLGLSAMVFLPTDHMGKAEDWVSCHRPPRPLMSWDRVRTLAAEGADFGCHTATHVDLSSADQARVVEELDRSADRIEEELGRRPAHFAPPYGHSTPDVRRMIAARFATSVGTRLGVAEADADLQDLPRLEMFYFTDLRRWRDQLSGRGQGYLAVRRLLRRLRTGLVGGPGRSR